MSSNIVKKLTAAELDTGLKGKNILLVGGTAGIGKGLAIVALRHGATVTVVGRRQPEDEAMRGAGFIKKDLSLMKNVVDLVKNEIDAGSLDAIVFTNGIWAKPVREETAEGIEATMAISALSRVVFLRTLLEKEALGSRRDHPLHKPRIFIMGRPGKPAVPVDVDDFNSERSYGDWTTMRKTVVTNEALVMQMAKEYAGAANVYGLDPGPVMTDLWDNILGGAGTWRATVLKTVASWFVATPLWFAENVLIHLLASPELEEKSGAIIDPKRRIIPNNPFLTKQENYDSVLAEATRLVDRALAHSSTGDS